MCWVDREGGGFWAVTTHPEVSHIGADPVGFCSSRGILTDEIGTTYDTPPTMMHTDPPQHTRYRRLVQPGFKPSMVRLMEAGVTAKATALLEQIEGGVAFDVVQDLSIPFPLLVICELLGVDGSQWPRFFDWSEAVIPGRGRADRGGAGGAPDRRCGSTSIGVAEERRQAPADDLVSVLANVGSIPERGGEDAERGGAGHVPDPAAGGGERDDPQPDLGRAGGAGRDPDQWAALQADRSLLPAAVEELLRWTTPVISFMRTATAATTIRGVRRSPRVTRCCWSTPRPTGTRRSSGPTPASSASTATPTRT